MNLLPMSSAQKWKVIFAVYTDSHTTNYDHVRNLLVLHSYRGWHRLQGKEVPKSLNWNILQRHWRMASLHSKKKTCERK